MPWDQLTAGFRAHHQHALNVALHLTTTPVAIVGATMCAAHFVPLPFIVGFHSAWAIVLACMVPSLLWVASAGLQALMCLMALHWHASSGSGPVGAALTFVGAYLAQEGAHILTCEATFQVSYQGKSDDWMWTLIEQCARGCPARPWPRRYPTNAP